jgi:hypothetical protein
MIGSNDATACSTCGELSIYLVAVYVKNTGRLDLSVILHMPAHCKFETLKNYREARRVGKCKFSDL